MLHNKIGKEKMAVKVSHYLAVLYGIKKVYDFIRRNSTVQKKPRKAGLS